MGLLQTILDRDTDAEASDIPGKPLPVPVLAEPSKVTSNRLGEARESTNNEAARLPRTTSDSRGGQPITSLAQALDACVAFLKTYMRFDSDYQAHVCALWSAYSWVFEAFDIAPYLFIRSPERGCGKSTLSQCIMALCPPPPRQVFTANISITSLARTIARHRAIMFLEEVDKFFAHGTDEPIVGILNAGWQRGATYNRYNIAIKDDEQFNIFGPKCFNGIGNRLDETTGSRCLTIRLNKQSPDDLTPPFRTSRTPKEAQHIRDFFAKWSKTAIDDLADIAERVEFPPEMMDGRMRDKSEPLLSVAELAGEEWKHIAQAGLVAITSEAEDSSDNANLLRDIRVVFETRDQDKLTSQELLDGLIRIDEGPWAVWWEKDLQAGRYNGPARKMGTMLGEFKIKSHNITMEDGEQRKGYLKADFIKPWKIYCPTEIQREQMGLL